MTDSIPATAATDRCDCGHLRGHHNTYQGNVYYLAHTRCQFKGCGCPKFIPRSQGPAAPKDDALATSSSTWSR